MTRTTDLRDLLTADGPFATVFLAGGRELDTRWRAVRERLTQAREPTVLALDKAIGTGPPAAGRFLIAAGESVLIDKYLPTEPAEPVARVSAWPYLVPLATSEPRRVPHVVVLVDKHGADLRAVDGDGVVIAEYSVTGRVAAETARLGQQTGAHLIVLVGDILPRTLLRRALPPGHARITAEVDSGRDTDSSIVDIAVAGLVAQRWQAEHDEVLDRFRSELRQDNGRAMQGLGPTTKALRDMAALVISDLGDQTVWVGATPRLVALEPGSPQWISGRADEVLPMAAVAAGADLLATDESLADGVGALLR